MLLLQVEAEAAMAALEAGSREAAAAQRLSTLQQQLHEAQVRPCSRPFLKSVRIASTLEFHSHLIRSLKLHLNNLRGPFVL